MDSVTQAIIAALSAGIAGGLTDNAKKAIVDGYEGLKSMVKKKFGSNNEISEAIEKLQAKPESPGRRATLAEEIKTSNAAADNGLLAAAQSLLELIKALPNPELHMQVAQGTGIAQADRGSSATVTISDTVGGKNNK